MIPGVVRHMSQSLKQPGRRERQVLAQDLVLHRVQHPLREDELCHDGKGMGAI